MKIALFINSMNKGGAERVCRNLAIRLQADGWDVLLVTQHKAEEEYPEIPGIPRYFSDLTPAEELPVTGNPAAKSIARIRNFRRRFRKLRSIWKETRPDIILSFIGKNNVMALRTAKELKRADGKKIPVVVSVRGLPSEEYKDPSLRKAAVSTFPKAAGIVVTTEQCRNELPEKIREKSVFLPNPIDPAFLRNTADPEKSHVILAVGRVDANKNHAMMVEAFAQVAQEFPEDTLVIYGDGPEREKLLAKVKALGLAERISLPGVTADVAGKLSESALFLLSSDTEGMPNTLLEAMAMNVPCISTDCPCGGPAQVMEDGKTGLLVPVGDTAALAEAIRRMRQDPAKAAAMGRAGGAFVRLVFAPDAAAGQWEKYLSEIAGRAS